MADSHLLCAWISDRSLPSFCTGTGVFQVIDLDMQIAQTGNLLLRIRYDTLARGVQTAIVHCAQALVLNFLHHISCYCQMLILPMPGDEVFIHGCIGHMLNTWIHAHMGQADSPVHTASQCHPCAHTR